MARRKEPKKAGAATSYLTRAQAIKRLQVSLRDFRRLCILKGIHPHAPRHPKKAAKGSTAPQTFYLLKDIQLITNEPVLAKFRAFRIYKRHLSRAVARRQRFDAQRIRKSKPTYKLNHIVKERYPTFVDAVRDLDDCLSLLFLFATFPTSVVKADFIKKSRQLTIEFLHYVIASRSLRKVFISVKGYYYQAEIAGEQVTWLVPHVFPFQRPSDVDFRIMSTFSEFYITLLGFVNYKLYHSLNLVYPPKLNLSVAKEEDERDYRQAIDDRIAALTIDLQVTKAEDQDQDQQPPVETGGDEVTTQKLLPEMLLGNDDSEETARLQQELAAADVQQRLFSGLKVFINREVPREPIVFVVRAFGGLVSWDGVSGADKGATFGENDPNITHQIVDRPYCERKHALSRAYVQPQWLFDCVNARHLLEVDQYLPGAALPPHLSPFGLASQGVDAEIQVADEKPEVPEEVPPALKRRNKNKNKKSKDQDEKRKDDEQKEEEEEEDKMQVAESRADRGAVGVRGLAVEAARKRTEVAERKLREMMMPKKHKRLYHKFSRKLEHEAKAERTLERKRKQIAGGDRVQKDVSTLVTATDGK